MAQLFDIKKVTVGPRTLTAEVEVAPNAPLLTSDDPEGTRLMVELMPQIADHVCLGDAGPHFGEVVEQTELAHLLEHVAVELLARTDAAGDISTGRTTQTGERTFEVELGCPDDVLVAGALSSAVWIMQWAYSGGGDPKPDVDAIASGLVDLVASVSEREPAEDEPAAEEAPVSVEEQPAEEPVQEEPEAEAVPVEAVPVEPAPEVVPEEEPLSPAAAFEPQSERPAPEQPQDGWGAYSGPRPKSVR